MSQDTSTPSSKASDLAVRLAEDIRQQYIENQVATRLPSERKLGQRFGVSRTVIRRSLELLQEAGLIRQQTGGRIRHIEPASRPEPELPRRHPLEPPPAFASHRTGAKTRLRLMAMDLCPGSPASVVQRWDQWKRDFVRENRRIEVELAPWQSGVITAAMVDGVDILQGPMSAAAAYQQLGFAADLQFLCRADPHFSHRRFDERLWAEVAARDTVAAIPFGVSFPIVVTSADTWARFGLGRVPEQWSWGEFLTVVERFQRATGKPGFALHDLTNLFASCGYDVATGLCRRRETEIAAALERILAVASFPHQRIQFDQVVQGELGFGNCMVSSVPMLREETRADWVFLPYPCDREGWLLRETLALFLHARTAAPVESWQFIRHLTALPQQRELARSHHLVPALDRALPMMAEADPTTSFAFIPAAYARTRPKPIAVQDAEFLETRVLGPELFAWYNGEQERNAFFFRVAVQCRLYLDAVGAAAARHGGE